MKFAHCSRVHEWSCLNQQKLGMSELKLEKLTQPVLN